VLLRGLVAIMATSVPLAAEVPRPAAGIVPRHHICYRAPAPPVIDGRLDDGAWARAAWTEDFVDILGTVKAAPRFRTRAKLLWDDTHLYIAAEMEEPDVWGTLKERDSVIFHDPDFEVFLDPDGDTHRYYELEINALGTVWDLFLVTPYRDSQRAALNGWDVRGLRSAVAVDGTLNRPGDRDRGWTVELAFPLAALGELNSGGRPPAPGDTWRLNFSRVEWQVDGGAGGYRKRLDPASGKPMPEDNWVWSPQGLVNMHYPEMWGYLRFSALVAGAGIESFQAAPEEAAKGALRQLYYAQRSWFDRRGRYTRRLSDLGLDKRVVPGYRWPPRLEITPSGFEARLDPTAAGANPVRIFQDGRTCPGDPCRR
jgi:Carbohydrate family 9 binding domain-like